MIPKFSDAVTIDWERNDFAFNTVLTVRFCASMQYHIKDGDEVDFEEVKDFVVEQLRLDVANSVGGMLATDERETLERRIDELCLENDQLRRRVDSLGAENAKLRERAVAELSELRGVVSEGDYDSPSGRYFLLRRDVAAYEDALRELGIEV